MFCVACGRPPNRLATNIARPAATSAGKRTRDLSCGAEKKTAIGAGDLKGCACHGPAQSDEQRPGVLLPADALAAVCSTWGG